MFNDFYKIDKQSEAHLRESIKNDPAELDRVKLRLSQLSALHSLAPGRCIVSDVQYDYLQRIVNSIESSA